MSCVGIWVIEFEIIVMLYMLNVNIFIYFDCVWKKYLGSFVDRLFLLIDGSIYFNYVNGNYYNVVEFVLNIMVLLNGNESNCDEVVNVNIKIQKRMYIKEFVDYLSCEQDKK